MEAEGRSDAWVGDAAGPGPLHRGTGPVGLWLGSVFRGGQAVRARSVVDLFGHALLGEGDEGVGDGAGGPVDGAADAGGGEGFSGVVCQVVGDELAQPAGGQAALGADLGDGRGRGGALRRYQGGTCSCSPTRSQGRTWAVAVAAAHGGSGDRGACAP